MSERNRVRIGERIAAMTDALSKSALCKLRRQFVRGKHWQFHDLGGEWHPPSDLKEPGPDSSEADWSEWQRHRTDWYAHRYTCEAALLLRDGTHVELRAALKLNRWFAIGEGEGEGHFGIQVWIRMPDGVILTDSFVYWFRDGNFTRSNCEDATPQPPEELAFKPIKLRYPCSEPGTDATLVITAQQEH